MKLTELLVVIAIIAVIAGLVLPATVKAYRHSKAWIWGAYAHNENRLNAALDGNDKALAVYCSAEVQPWSFVKVP